MAKIISISSDVVDVRFTKLTLPAIGTILKTKSGAILSTELAVSDTVVKTVIMKNAEGISVGETVTSTKKPIQAPVGKSALGRIFNVLGEPIDGKPRNPKTEDWIS